MCVYVCERLEMINRVKTGASDEDLELYFPHIQLTISLSLF